MSRNGTDDPGKVRTVVDCVSVYRRTGTPGKVRTVIDYNEDRDEIAITQTPLDDDDAPRDRSEIVTFSVDMFNLILVALSKAGALPRFTPEDVDILRAVDELVTPEAGTVFKVKVVATADQGFDTPPTDEPFVPKATLGNVMRVIADSTDFPDQFAIYFDFDEGKLRKKRKGKRDRFFKLIVTSIVEAWEDATAVHGDPAELIATRLGEDGDIFRAMSRAARQFCVDPDARG